MVQFFKELFNTSGPVNIEGACAAIKMSLCDEGVRFLEERFTPIDVKHALFQMQPSKSPGPDGFTAGFYQKIWHIIGGDMTNMVLDILNNGADPTDINQTYVCLIPKVKTPETPKEFRPISLSNVVMRVVTKCLANRIKPVLDELIGEQQSAFAPGRQITDHALAGFEVFHYMKRMKGKKGVLALKLDMSKAYDRVEWEFLRAALCKMKFPNHLIEVIMRCVTSVSYGILINGEPTPWFQPHRELRQGDPLSPYLFIMCVEAFSGLLLDQMHNRKTHGVVVARGAPEISHLFFADDSLIFFQGYCGRGFSSSTSNCYL